MLILTRKAGEDVVITVPDKNGAISTILIKVLKAGNIIKLGFEAPEDISIVRSELLESPLGDSK